jgi:hypothetical protein
MKKEVGSGGEGRARWRTMPMRGLHARLKACLDLRGSEKSEKS